MYKPYLAMIKISFTIFFQYIVWFWSTIFSAFIGLFVTYFLWIAILKDQVGSVGGFSNKYEMISFMIIAYSISLLMKSSFGSDLSSKIKLGTLAIDLIKPVALIPFLASKEIGKFLNGFIFLFCPLITFSILFLKIDVLITQIIYFIISLFLGYLVLLSFTILTSLLVFVTENWWGLQQLTTFIITFFSGALVPISFMPKFLQIASSFLPFQSMVSIPSKIFIQNLAFPTIFSYFTIQLFWILFLNMITYIIWKKFITKNIFVNGG